MRIFRFAAGVGQDCRYAVRVLVRARGQALLAIATIALAIGANTTIFSVVNATELAPLPFPESERIVQVAHRYADGSVDSSVSVPKYLFVREQASSFEALAAYQDLGGSGVNLTGEGDRPERVGATRVASTFFDVLGVQPSAGRAFRPEENQPGRGDVVVLSHRLWTRRYGAAADIFHRTIAINDRPHRVVGVMPASFNYPEWAELWIPLEIDRGSAARHGFLDVIGRLRPDTSLDATRAEMHLVSDAYQRSDPADVLSESRLDVRPLREALYGFLRPALLMLLAAVGAVLLVACVNVANLQLARGMTRSGEVAVRFALGATRGRIIRQLLVDSAVLALLGGAAGLWLSAFLLPALIYLAPPELQNLPAITVDVRVLASTLILSLATALLFGLMPARAVAATHARAVTPGRGVTGARASTGARRATIAAEVALAVILASGAALLARSFVTLAGADSGFQPHGLLTMQLHFSGTRYESPAAFASAVTRAVEETSAIPGVRAVALSTSLPFGTGTGMPFTIEGRVSDPQAGAGRMRYVGATPDFFAAMGIRLVRGRGLEARDRVSAPLVAVINETAAREFWPGAEAIGQRITIGQPVNPEIADPTPREIVGIVADVREWGMTEGAPPIVYAPQAQIPPPFEALFKRLLPFSLVLRADQDPELVASTVQAAVQRVDTLLPITGVRTGDQLLMGSLQTQQFNTLLMGVLALVAVVLAFSGIYGVVSCLVAQRTGEIGVRLALGATRHDVLRLMIRQGLVPAVIGAVAGFAATLLSSRLLASLLFGAVSSTDPLALGGGAIGVLMMAAAAAYIPARRAAKLDPVRSLRVEV